MFIIFLAAILFGLTHVGSKILISEGISLYHFVFFFIGIRVIIQIPIILKNKRYKLKDMTLLTYYLLFGVFGAALLLTEFFGISKGLPVPIVTFLVYSHPIWTLLLDKLINKKEITLRSIIRLTLAISGVVIISGMNFRYFKGDMSLLLGPLSGGFFLAVWICLSSKLRTMTSDSLQISFYFDFLSLIFLALFLALFSVILPIPIFDGNGFNFSLFYDFLTNPLFMVKMIFYSIFIGLVPSYLFYKGQSNLSAFSSGLILLLEPIISTVVSYFLWKEELGLSFYFGALLILSANFPDKK